MKTGYKITNLVQCVIHIQIHIPIYHFNQTSIDFHENHQVIFLLFSFILIIGHSFLTSTKQKKENIINV